MDKNLTPVISYAEEQRLAKEKRVKQYGTTSQDLATTIIDSLTQHTSEAFVDSDGYTTDSLDIHIADVIGALSDIDVFLLIKSADGHDDLVQDIWEASEPDECLLLVARACLVYEIKQELIERGYVVA